MQAISLARPHPRNLSSRERKGDRVAPFLHVGDDVGKGPERCRSAERYSRSAGACEPKDIRAAQRVGGVVFRGQAYGEPLAATGAAPRRSATALRAPAPTNPPSEPS